MKKAPALPVGGFFVVRRANAQRREAMDGVIKKAEEKSEKVEEKKREIIANKNRKQIKTKKTARKSRCFHFVSE